MSSLGIVCDIGGVLLDGSEPMPGAAEALAAVHDAGLALCLLSNTTSQSKRQLLKPLQALDPRLSAKQVVTPIDVARDWLSRHGYAAWPMVADALLDELSGLDGVCGEAVVIGDLGDGFNYTLLNEAFQRLNQGAALLALGKTRFYQRGGQRHLDSGPFVHALEYAAGVEAIVCGKPAASSFAFAAQTLGLTVSSCTMLGDDAQSDIKAALDAGMAATLIRTGKYRRGDEQHCQGASEAADVLSAVEAILDQA